MKLISILVFVGAVGLGYMIRVFTEVSQTEDEFMDMINDDIDDYVPTEEDYED